MCQLMSVIHIQKSQFIAKISLSIVLKLVRTSKNVEKQQNQLSAQKHLTVSKIHPIWSKNHPKCMNKITELPSSYVFNECLENKNINVSRPS